MDARGEPGAATAVPAGEDRLSSRLKRETAGLHRAVEERLALDDPELTPGRYAAVLSLLLELHEGVERSPLAAEAWWLLGLSRHERRKSDWLRRDLATLGHPARPARPPGFRGPFDAVGALYVLEGSTLGGRMLSRIHGSRRELRGATRFFEGYGDRTGSRWKTFVARLDRTPPRGPRADAAACGARRTFEALLLRARDLPPPETR